MPDTVVDTALARGADEARWVEPGSIVVARWVRMKCEFGCPLFGKGAACPPNLPPIEQCRELFGEYRRALLLRFSGSVESPEARHVWTREINESLLALERDVFLAGHPKAFVLFVDPCNLCEQCAGARHDCHDKARARPSPEGLGVDVFATAEAAGMPIRVLTDFDQTMNRYAMLLVD